jgi:hypothetical protein
MKQTQNKNNNSLTIRYDYLNNYNVMKMLISVMFCLLKITESLQAESAAVAYSEDGQFLKDD